MGWSNKAYRSHYTQVCENPASSTPKQFRMSPTYAGSHSCPSSAVVCYGGWIKPWGSTEDIETGSGSGSGLGRSRDNGIFDQISANDAVYVCFGSDGDGRRSATLRQSLRQAPRRKAAVHSRWCALQSARFDKSPLGEGVKNNY